MPRYATAEEYRAYREAPTSTGEYSDATIDLFLDEAEAWIEWRCATEFGPSDPAERDYWGEGVDLLLVDPCYEIVSVTAVDDDGTTEAVEADTYAGVPPLGSRGAVQFTHLQRLPVDRRVWTGGCRYRLEARYGMASVPAGVKLAVMEFAAIRRLESKRAQGAAMLTGDDVVSAIGNRIVDLYLDRWVQPDADSPRVRFKGAGGRQ